MSPFFPLAKGTKRKRMEEEEESLNVQIQQQNFVVCCVFLEGLFKIESAFQLTGK